MADPRKQMQDAIAERDKSTVKSLLNSGVDINANLGGGIRPIHCAIMSHDRDMMTFLDKEGADLMIRSSDGSTPLHFAVTEWKATDTPQDKVRTIEQLCRLGADVNATNAKGVTALDLAVASNRHTLAACLRRYGGKEGPGAASLPKESPDLTLKRHIETLRHKESPEVIEQIVAMLKAQDEDELKKLVRVVSAGIGRMEPDPACNLLVAVGRHCADRGDISSANLLFQAGKPLAKKCRTDKLKASFSNFQKFRGVAAAASSGGGSGGGQMIVKAVVGLVVVGGLAFGGYKILGASGGSPDPNGSPVATSSPSQTPGQTPTPGASPTKATATGTGDPKEHLKLAQEALDKGDVGEATRQAELALDSGADGDDKKAALTIAGKSLLAAENFDAALKIFQELESEEMIAEVGRQKALHSVGSLMNQAQRGLRGGNLGLASKSLAKAITVLEENEGSEQALAEAFSLQGRVELALGNFETARKATAKAVKLDPDNEDYQADEALIREADASRIARSAIAASRFQFPAVKEGSQEHKYFYFLSDSTNQNLGSGGEYWVGERARYKLSIENSGEGPPTLTTQVQVGRTTYTVRFSGDSGQAFEPKLYDRTHGLRFNEESLKGAFRIYEMQTTQSGKVLRLAADFHGTDGSGAPVFGKIRYRTKF